MSKLDIGQSVNTLANIGVIVGLLFLVFELQQNNETLQLQIDSENRERVNSVVELVVNNPEYTRLMAKEDADLTEYERDRLTVLGVRMLLNLEDLHRDVVAGRIAQEDAVRRSRGIWVRDKLNYGAPIAWETYKSRAAPDFIAWMEAYVVPDSPTAE